jgi:hypothetical protein
MQVSPRPPFPPAPAFSCLYHSNSKMLMGSKLNLQNSYKNIIVLGIDSIRAQCVGLSSPLISQLCFPSLTLHLSSHHIYSHLPLHIRMTYFFIFILMSLCPHHFLSSSTIYPTIHSPSNFQLRGLLSWGFSRGWVGTQAASPIMTG